MAWPNEIVTRQLVSKSKLLGAKGLRRRLTSAERILWNGLRNDKLGVHFRRQQVIAGFIADFYCHSAALVIEVDGPVHDGRITQDAKRELVLIGLRLQILRFTNEEILQDLPAVLRKIKSLVSSPLPFREGGWG